MTSRYAIEALDADGAALSAAGSAAEEALALHRQALAVLEDGWRSESGSAATEVVRRQCAQAADLVDALHGAAAELRALRYTLDPIGAAASQFDPLTGDPLAADPSAGDPLAADQLAADPLAAGLADRVAPRFETPVATLPPPAPPSAPWSSGFGSGVGPVGRLPDFGGVLAGLVNQIADVLSVDHAQPADGTVNDEDPVPSRQRPLIEEISAAELGSSAGEPAAAPPERLSPVQETAASTPAATTLPESRLPQPQSPPPQAPPELLAAELPPAPRESAPDGETPCDIAVDELPQVGE